ncbi:YjfB family protein [Vallitalea okinawensis]|uniref:YjfB family protein n=1 Tax=Vallitalea okinawensis TaxID=2078660 RepID=UPI000CFBEBB3|nr:YjfB family protein [Vallitalea okinawensis]
MDIAALSTAMSQMSLAQEVSVAVTSKAMDMTEQTGDAMRHMLEQSVTPHIGGNIDIQV